MLARRDLTLDLFSQKVYNQLPLSDELSRIKQFFPEEKIMEIAAKFYDLDMGRSSEDPVLLTKIMFLSFYFDVDGDEKTLETLKYRIDWRQFCDLSLDDDLPDRTTLVKFRRTMGLDVINSLFKDFLERLATKELIDLNHRFFDGTPSKARARIDPYRDEIYEETLKAIDEKLVQFKENQVVLDPDLNTTPVNLEKMNYPSDNKSVDERYKQPMKPVSERQSAGDPDAHFQRGKHGKKGELGYEIFFTTDGKELFITDVDVSEEASKGQEIFIQKLEESQPGQKWSVDGEFTTGEILTKAEKQEVILNTPARPSNARGVFPKTEFIYDPEKDCYTCPNGQTLNLEYTDKNSGDKRYRCKKEACQNCPFKDDCTTSENGRTISRSVHEEQFQRNQEHTRTPEGVLGKVLRGIIAEGKFAEGVRHGLKKMRYVGKKMALMQSNLVALILNFKRLLRIEAVQGVIL